MDKLEVMEKHSRIVTYSAIGEVYYLKKKGVRRVSIVLKPFKGVVVTMPYSVRFDDAERFVLQKTEWIAMAKAKMASLETRRTVFTESTLYKTKKRTLTFVRHAAEKSAVSCRILQDEIRISIPEGVSTEHPTVQDLTVKAIERAWTLEAKELLPQRVLQLASRCGFMFGNVAVKKIKSRWGSCSFQNNINLSVYLMQLPDSLIDYVILHELCHTVEKNHGPKFWALLDRHTDAKAKLLAKEMKKYSTRYF
jgi:predicted metal-dependent hydrolase